MTQLYEGTKRVLATPMNRGDYNAYRGWQVPSDESPTDEGYLVEYTDGGKANDPRHTGYISWSPRDVFDRAYRSVGASLSFGDALKALKDGKRVTRAGWNGKGMWIEYWRPMHPIDLPHLMLMYPVGSTAYPNGARVPWLASQTDVLAGDWTVL